MIAIKDMESPAVISFDSNDLDSVVVIIPIFYRSWSNRFLTVGRILSWARVYLACEKRVPCHPRVYTETS